MEEKNKNIEIDGQQEALLFQDACTIIEQAQVEAYRAVDVTLIKRNWLLGMRINKDVLKEQRAEYGKQVVKNLSQYLIERYGRGFSMRNLYNFVDFYQSHPDIFYAVSGKAEFTDILQSVTAKSLTNEKQLPNILQTLIAKYPIRLTWSHYSIILQDQLKRYRYHDLKRNVAPHVIYTATACDDVLVSILQSTQVVLVGFVQ